MAEPASVIFVTGGGGYLGTQIVGRLAGDPRFRVVSFDLRQPSAKERLPSVEYVVGDVRDQTLSDAIERVSPDVVVHLASIVNPGGPEKREFEYSVDVGGTDNVLSASARARVRHLIITSSGAAYGYHADNPVPLRESDPLRGNPEFPYAHHKRLIEEKLAAFRQTHPELKQLVLRPGTILGRNTDNRITSLFHQPVILGIAGYETPFVFLWDEDVVEIVVRGICNRVEGIFNLAGDGTLSLRDIARLTGKRYLPIPPVLFRLLLATTRLLGLSASGPEQLIFLQYRPVLANDKLHQQFPFDPRMTTQEVFEYYWQARKGSPHGSASPSTRPS